MSAVSKKTQSKRNTTNTTAADEATYFWEIPNNVRSLFVDFRENVEDKWLHVKI